MGRGDNLTKGQREIRRCEKRRITNVARGGRVRGKGDRDGINKGIIVALNF